MLRNATDDTIRLVNTGQAAKALGVSGNTLRSWANRNLIDFELTPGGQRRFNINTVRQADSSNLHAGKSEEAKKGAIYCRVSSGKRDLQRQVQTMQDTYPGFKVYKDVESGLN